MLPTRILILTATLLALCTPAAHANSYWVSLGVGAGQPGIQPGTDGFTVTSHGGPFKTYGSHCEAQPGTYVAGAYCRIKWSVPAGLTAGTPSGGGILRGDFRTASDLFVLRSERPGGNPANVIDSPGDGAFNHGFGALGNYVEIGLRTTAAVTTTSSANWFHINSLDVLLNDPSAPVIYQVAPSGGQWKGQGCTPLVYGWADSGSQMWSSRVDNLTTGAQVHAWTHNPGRNVIQSGLEIATHATCLPAQPTGHYSYRTTGTDRSGNTSTYDFGIDFDTTSPTVSAPTLAGTAIADNTAISAYRPAVTWSINDEHSGVAAIAARLDGAPIPFQRAGAVVTLASPSDLPLGSHQLTLTIADAVGNETTVARTIRIVDTVAPTITMQQPGTLGGNLPILDLTATDDRSGLATTTWQVTVNGQPLVLASSGARLQADLGYLVDGTHTIEARIADNAGNAGRITIRYTARSKDSATPLPGLTGLYILDAPTAITEGTPVRIRAAAVRYGRPLTGMRAELHQGSATIAGKPISTDGTVDIAVAIKDPTPILMTINGSGFADEKITFVYTPLPPSATTPNATSAAAAAAPGSATAGAQSGANKPPATPPVIVERVVDGDTLRLRDGRTVRLLQIDAPEVTECYGGRATAALRRLLKPGTQIRLTTDPRLDNTDTYGRLLRYVWIGRRNLNRQLVQQGVAGPYFFGGKRGQYAGLLLNDTIAARKAKQGFWSACPGTRITPNRGTNTGPT